MKDFNLPKPISASKQAFYPKNNVYKPDIDKWRLDDKKPPRKQHHTAQRVFKRLQNEKEDFNCSYRLVAVYVAAKKKELYLG
jgi:hypothetical protein